MMMIMITDADVDEDRCYGSSASYKLARCQNGDDDYVLMM